VSAGDPFLGIEDELRALVRASTGGDVADVEPLTGGGLAHRRFYRVTLRNGEPATLIARADRGEPAPGVLPEPALEPLRTFLEAHGLPVPRRLGGDAARGLDLLEDLGDVSLAQALESAGPAQRRALYEEACSLVPRLQRLADPGGRVPAFGRKLDATLFRVKAQRFAASGLPVLLGRAATAAERDVVFAAFDAVASAAASAPQRLAHRDFQSKNLILRAHPRGLAMIDLQGALLAPPEYDLVCLLRDSYVVLADDECAALAESVRPSLPDAPAADVFAQRFDLLTITRKAKDFALFHEVAARGDASWLRYASATLGYVRRALGRVAGSDGRLARLAEVIGDDACVR
jgi:aminoglycoside/choline kinase family phosphotransferase